jgi:hypothetical protein
VRRTETKADSYIKGQSAWLVNYAERYCAGLCLGASITEGTANFLVNRRMNKSQQMRWSRRRADLLPQVRCAVTMALSVQTSATDLTWSPIQTRNLRWWHDPPNLWTVSTEGDLLLETRCAGDRPSVRSGKPFVGP